MKVRDTFITNDNADEQEIMKAILFTIGTKI